MHSDATAHPGDSPLRLLEQDTLARSRALDCAEAQADLERLRRESVAASRLVERLGERGWRIAFDGGPAGIEVAIRDRAGATLLRLRPSDVVDLERLRMLLAGLAERQRRDGA